MWCVVVQEEAGAQRDQPPGDGIANPGASAGPRCDLSDTGCSGEQVAAGQGDMADGACGEHPAVQAGAVPSADPPRSGGRPGPRRGPDGAPRCSGRTPKYAGRQSTIAAARSAPAYDIKYGTAALTNLPRSARHRRRGSAPAWLSVSRGASMPAVRDWTPRMESHSRAAWCRDRPRMSFGRLLVVQRAANLSPCRSTRPRR